MNTIIIKECGGEGRSFTSSHRTSDVDDAVERAVRKAFGKRCWFLVDRGLTTNSGRYRWGQIARPVKSGGSSLSGRMCVEIIKEAR